VDSVTNSYTDALGHNDPDISPDGKRIAFTYNARRQGQGQPRIGIIKYPVRKTTPDLSPKGRGYANPSWSPDGRYLAAERVTPDKRDVVILDPDTWEEVARLTTDGRSFAPVWSPNGDQIAYLHVDESHTNLRVITLAQGTDRPTLERNEAVTVDGKVDPESPPAWFIPRDQRTNLATEAPEAGDGAASTAGPEGTTEP
jgi:Tol biopolymer transport system component